MLNVHLFFTKKFGGMIMEGKVPIDIAGFSAAILKNRAHPNMYLKFGRGPAMTGGTDLEGWQTPDRSKQLVGWFYQVNTLAVCIMFVKGEGKVPGFANNWWHPRFGTSKLVISDFDVPD